MKPKSLIASAAMAAFVLFFFPSCSTNATLGTQTGFDKSLDQVLPEGAGPGIVVWDSEPLIYDDLETLSKEKAESNGKGFENFAFTNDEVESIQMTHFDFRMACADDYRPWTSFSELILCLKIYLVPQDQQPVLVAEAETPFNNEWNSFFTMGEKVEVKDYLLDGTSYQMRLEWDLKKEVEEGYGLLMNWTNAIKIYAERKGKWTFKGRKYE